mmetsp:Transcript_22770/g.32770  ORF Transcript_22770/g.32770 Transcript_22770/m.32770 type:complete len:94 (-) Transcript_22770:494-775(-)
MIFRKVRKVQDLLNRNSIEPHAGSSSYSVGSMESSCASSRPAELPSTAAAFRGRKGSIFSPVSFLLDLPELLRSSNKTVLISSTPLPRRAEQG